MRLITQKAKRIAAGEKPRVLDLFAGCGGLSLGFLAAGCRIVASVEIDDHAARSHGTNFHPGDDRHAQTRDITKTPPQTLTDHLQLGDPKRAFDIIVGGPPCQAFARVGRSKLREVANHPEAFRHDPRSKLYINYLSYVDVCHPLALVLENVPDMLNFGGRHNIAEEVCEVLSERGYSCVYTLLNSAHYGVPQMRDRAFVLAIRRELTDDIGLPEPSHWIQLPSGYQGSRAVALKLIRQSNLFSSDRFWMSPPNPSQEQPEAITAREAIDDLPRIDARADLDSGRLRRGTRRLNNPIPYPVTTSLSDFALAMREWPGFEATDSVSDHVIRYLPRDYDLFARLKPGDQYPQAYNLALRLFDEALSERRSHGGIIPEHSQQWQDLRSSIVPPYDASKFPNKWRKMEADKPARTLMAHLGKDSYSHIHYDSKQARTISVREAARLQSFPDGFQFQGTMNPAFRQIGNAVPPLLAKAIANRIVSQITRNSRQSTKPIQHKDTPLDHSIASLQ